MQYIRNLFIFSSKGDWKSFFKTICITLCTLFICGYVFIVVIDPYDSIGFSPAFDRAEVGGQERFFHPGLAAKKRFDSAIIGASTIRLLRPDLLNPLFDCAFVNLGINLGSVFEQEKIFSVFRRNHERPKVVIFGIDGLYFKESLFVRFLHDKTDLFPEWLYDENPYNNLPPFHLRVLKHSWRQFLFLSGLKKYKYGEDGYTEITPPMGEYDIRKSRLRIYGTPDPKIKGVVNPPLKLSEKKISEFRFPAIKVLERMLQTLPDETIKILFIVPFHTYVQAESGSLDEIRWRVFKRRIATLCSNYKNIYLLDFMIDSPITTQDSNYWDAQHYTTDVAALLPNLIHKGCLDPKPDPNFVRLFPRSSVMGNFGGKGRPAPGG